MATTPIDAQHLDVHARFRLLLKELNHSANSFARLIGVNPSQIVNVVGGRLNKPSLETLEKVSQTVPRVNMDWLIGGKGEMMKPYSGQEQPSVTSDVVVGYGNAVGSGNRTKVRAGAYTPALEDCQQELLAARARIKELESTISDKQLIIELLKREK